MASQYDLPYTGPQVETLLAKISELESEMPSKTSDLANDSGFITSADVPTKTSDLNNDSGFITNAPIAAETARAQAAEALLATISSLQAEISRATSVEGTLQDLIDGIAAKIPSAASEQNQLADKAFVNSSIATASATFRGTFDTLAALQAASADENDYAFLATTDAAGNTVYKRYKYSGGGWVFEYELNNSSFTAAQWAAINSAITAALVEKLRALPTGAALQEALDGKQPTLVFDDVPTAGSDNPVRSKGIYGSYNDLRTFVANGAMGVRVDRTTGRVQVVTLEGGTRIRSGAVDPVTGKVSMTLNL